MRYRESTFTIQTKRVPYLLNRAFRAGVSIGDVILGEREVTVTVPRKCRAAFLSILREEGVNFTDNTVVFRLRPVLAVSFVLAAILVIVFGSFVYGVDISGNRTVNTADIEAVLSAHRVDGFTYKKGIDLDAIRRDVTALGGISFVSVGIKGSTLYVNVKEELPAAETEAENTAPVLATRSGVVTKVVCESGTALVKAGDVVTIGDTLIAPVYRFTEGEAPAPAKGEVWASTVYCKEVVLPQISVQNERTGRTFSVRTLRLFGREYAPLFTVPFSQYDVSERVVYSCGFVSVTERIYHERADAVVCHDFDLEAPALFEKARLELLAEVPFYAYATGGVVAEEKKMDNVYYVVLYYTVVQRIDSLFLPNDRQQKEAWIG